MGAKPRRNERGLVMPPGPRAIPRTNPPRRARDRNAPAPDAADVPPVVAKAAGDLLAIGARIRSCPVCAEGGDGRFALGSGHPRAAVMLLRDRPTEADLDAGVAFADEAPSLEKAFAALAVPLSWVYGTTAARSAGGRACPDHLLGEIEAVEPSVLVAFGPRAVDAVRSLDGRCGLSVPADVPQGTPVTLRPGLVLVATEPLPEGVTRQDGKRRLWRDLRQVPALVGTAEPR